MARMMGRNYKTGLCSCLDCGTGGEPRGRAAERRLFTREIEEEIALRDEEVALACIAEWFDGDV
ncbi:hypothetical protein [Tsukamurella paurometabola]|uniref:Uncharacterized protein n=1 Tax=Tsukamurella paurometabola TaxID=2061 RepID=A0ABS5NG38_TSUPA|nr:hypothetical protein [Tsukamurella paurometabola]MBS4102398.1 hypothetical protein [Tsukamurella paurometabola]